MTQIWAKKLIQLSSLGCRCVYVCECVRESVCERARARLFGCMRSCGLVWVRKRVRKRETDRRGRERGREGVCEREANM
jgi:hypothetical protein